MVDKLDSALYRYISVVGPASITEDQINFRPLNLYRALDAIVADGERGFFESLYARRSSHRPFRLEIDLAKPEVQPDITKWDDTERINRYFEDCVVIYDSGRWDKTCFDTTNDRVEPFDPERVHPKPQYVYLTDVLENYGALACLAARFKQEGYFYTSLTLSNALSVKGETQAGRLHLTWPGESTFRFSSRNFAYKYFGSIIPWLLDER